MVKVISTFSFRFLGQDLYLLFNGAHRALGLQQRLQRTGIRPGSPEKHPRRRAAFPGVTRISIASFLFEQAWGRRRPPHSPGGTWWFYELSYLHSHQLLDESTVTEATPLPSLHTLLPLVLLQMGTSVGTTHSIFWAHKDLSCWVCKADVV